MSLILTICVVIVAAAFRGITGFGYALIAAVGLSSSLPSDVMIPLILVNDLLITLLILSNRKHGAIDKKVAPMLLILGFLGALMGGYLVSMIDETTTKFLVAVIVFISALLAMVHEPPKWLGSRWIGAPAALLVGALLAGFAVGGPLIAVWLLAGGTKREYTLGTLAVFFGAGDLFGLLGRIVTDQVDSSVYSLLLIYVPLTLIGYAIGHFIGIKLDQITWRRVSALGLVLIAVAGGAQTLMGLLGVQV